MGLVLLGAATPAFSQTLPSSFPQGFVDHQGVALFFAEDEAHGRELWRSDGTESGTLLLRDLVPGPEGSGPHGWGQLGGNRYFLVCRNYSPRVPGRCGDQRGLWRTDGTPAGTVRVRRLEVWPGQVVPFAGFRGRLYFAANDGVSGLELWRSDGTEAGTEIVADLHPGPDDSAPHHFFVHDDAVYFGAQDASGPGLWRSDGTAAGTRKLASLTGGYGGAAWSFAELDERLFFSADDGKRGEELWTTNGTAKGTRLVAEIRKGPKGGRLFEMTELGGRLYFSATDGREREVFRTDGTKKGTERFELNPRGPSYPDHMLRFGDQILLFASMDPVGGELYAIGAGRAFTGLVRDIFPGEKGSHPNLLTQLENRVLFAAEDDRHGMELWVTDGTEAGTEMVLDLWPGPQSGRPRELRRVGDRVFFNANDGATGVELWISDGTGPGTRLVRDIRPGPARDERSP